MKKTLTIKKSEYHPKEWGYELWIHNDSKYCGKLLFFKEGKRCSLHYHKIKHETFYLQSGKMLLEYKRKIYDKTIETLLTPGDVFEIPVETTHRLTAIEDSELFEFSTQHFEDDSYRIIKGD
tara:strand:+ start:1928 stop:2293 length:366 start_codon:yes stop_codon:yes gene_type:complete